MMDRNGREWNHFASLSDPVGSQSPATIEKNPSTVSTAVSQPQTSLERYPEARHCMDNTDVTHPRTLTSLPSELFDQVASYATIEDLISLRLVSKQCNERSLRSFAQAFFSDIKVILSSEGSLRNAIRRADHPFFGRFVRSITVVIDEYKIGCGHCKVLYEAQQRIQSHKVDLSLLTTLFRMTEKAERAQAVDLVSISAATRWNAREDGQHSANECLAPPAMGDARAFSVIMEALSSSGLQIRRLLMATPSWSLPLHRLSQEDVGRWKDGLQKVECLELDVWADIRYCRRAKLAGLWDALGLLPQLRRLSIRGRDQSDPGFDVADVDRPDPSVISTSLLAAAFPQLRSLTLTSISMSAAQLSDFSHRHADLDQIKLCDPWIVGSREFDIRYHLPRQMCETLRRLTGKDDVHVEFEGGWDSWKWATRVPGREPFGRW